MFDYGLFKKLSRKNVARDFSPSSFKLKISWRLLVISSAEPKNAEPKKPDISHFCEIYNTKNIKEKACFKNPQNPTCIDLILANRPRSFQDSTVLEAGLPDFHKMSVTVMKMYHCRQKPSVITYRKLKIFSNIEFTKDLEEHFTKFEHFGNIPFNLSKETVNIILEKLRNLLRKNM